MVSVPSFGKYRPLAELGRGGMATVYLAAHVGPGGFTKLVVVKELREELAGELEFREMFMDEARLAARLNHPNIVQTYEVTEDEARPLIVMEYLEGQAFSNVRVRLGRDRTLSLEDHVRVLSDMLEGLHAAHELRDWNGAELHVVHRDVSPHNVFVTYGGDVKVVDFGIAKAATSSQHTRTGVIKGKISYMAPEQALGRKVDRRADLFAAGVMLWEAVATRRMWKDMPDPGIIHHLSTGEIPLVRDFALDPDPLLEHACARSLALDPAQRYASAAEMRADLEAFLARRGRPTPRALGDRVAHAFEKEREKIRRVIEEQMQKATASPSAPQLLPTLGEATGEGSAASAAIAGSTSAATPAARVAIDARAPEPMTASGALAVETGPRIPTMAPPPSGKRTLLAVALGALAALAIAGVLFGVFVLRGGDGDKGAAGTGAANTGATMTAPPPTTAITASATDPSAAPPASTTATASATAKPTARPTAKPTAKPTATTTTTKPLDIELKR